MPMLPLLLSSLQLFKLFPLLCHLLFQLEFLQRSELKRWLLWLWLWRLAWL